MWLYGVPDNWKKAIVLHNSGYTYRDNISTADAGLSALEYYLRHYHHSSEEEWRAHFHEGRIRRGEEILSEVSLLQAGDRISYSRPAWDEEDVPTVIPLLSEGDGWLVFAKPSGLPVLPGGGFLENTMLRLLRRSFGENLAPVHRLGRGTSGAMLFTNSDAAASMLSAAMRERRIEKTYLALVVGLPEKDSFTVDIAIGRVPHPTLHAVYAAMPGGKPSISHCRVLHRDAAQNVTLLEVRIPTGRPHQIRIHCAAAGFPLQGDPLYGIGGTPLVREDGSVAVPGDCGYHLHSWKLCFPSLSGEGMVTVEAPPPVVLNPS
ncbi:RNA pseudouridine synthase [bacterium]|nr:RNA pseudouridine synthase [bacterium]